MGPIEINTVANLDFNNCTMPFLIFTDMVLKQSDVIFTHCGRKQLAEVCKRIGKIFLAARISFYQLFYLSKFHQDHDLR